MVILVIPQLGFTIEVTLQMIMTVDFQQEAGTQQAREKGPLLSYFSPKLQIIWYTCVVLLYKCCQYSKIN